MQVQTGPILNIGSNKGVGGFNTIQRLSFVKTSEGGFLWISPLNVHLNKHGFQNGLGKSGLILWNTSPFTLVETEELLYGLSSFIAEVGGTLGLFLGFSVMAIWDGMEEVTNLIAKKCLSKSKRQSVPLYLSLFKCFSFQPHLLPLEQTNFHSASSFFSKLLMYEMFGENLMPY